ncbi:unnamed protein product [Cylicocyclus nassatus]|uniref:Dolichyl-diphosphooligosaccharide--protein glycosyltransferase subunit 2 n=1 Tax=Cylicocyclus nassatus TaxID=53992 RepID=A0AA36HI40_CYLNA|nr:unnamed protein product [Cylicocyclus nassatus]
MAAISKSMMRPLIILLFTIFSVSAVSLNTHWEDQDTKWLTLVLEDILVLKSDSLIPLHYATSTLKLLKVQPSEEAAFAACEAAQKADVTELDNLYDAASITGDLPDCTLPDVSGAKKLIDGVITEITPNGERIYRALRTAERLNIKVNQEAFDKILAEAMKDDNPLNLGWVMNAAALLNKPLTTKYFDKIKNLVAQADEVNKKFLQFEGGLIPTAIAVHGILSLAEKHGQVPALSKEQMILFTNYLMSRKHVSTERSAYHLVKTLGVLVNNHQIVPVTVSRVGPVMSDRSQPVKVAVANVFGLPVEVSDVHVDIVPSGSEKAVKTNLKMKRLDSDPMIWTINADQLPEDNGFVNLNVKIDTKDKRLVGLTSSSVVIKKSDDVTVDDFKIAVVEKDETITGASLKSIPQFSKHKDVFNADVTKRIQATFSVKQKSKSGLIQPHQAFILFKHENGDEVYYTADAQKDGKYIADINLAKSHKDFEGLSGKYTAYLIIGDARIRTPLSWAFADFTVTVPPVAKKEEPKSHRVDYQPKPEIKHVFRKPEKRPSAFVSDTFTFFCLAPLLLLLILWLRIGLNFTNMPASIWTLLFHLGLMALFALYFIFWLRLNMFTTLKYLAGIAAFTFLAGNRVLRAIAEKRKHKTE